MEKSIVSDSLNKGVPVDAPIDIRMVDFINIVDHKEEASCLIEKYFQEYMAFLGSLGKNVDIEYFYTMRVIVDEDTLERKIIFSPSGYGSTLVLSLNIDGVCKDRDACNFLGELSEFKDEYFGKFQDRIEILRSVKNPDDLRKNFPVLYNRYQEICANNSKWRQFAVNINRMNRKQKRDFVRRFDSEQRKIIPDFSLEKQMSEVLTFSVSKFTESSASVFTMLLDNYSKIINYLYTHPIDISGLQIGDQNKLELYLANLFLDFAQEAREDRKQDYLYYVSNFFAEHSDLLDSDLSIVVDSFDKIKIGQILQVGNRAGRVITPRSLYDNYCQMLVSNPNLRAIDFSHLDFNGMKATEVKKFMDEYLRDLSVNWDFLAPDDKSYEEEVIRKIKSSGQGMSVEDRESRQLRLLELFMEKKNLYDSSDPFFRVKGKDTFDGYIGYVYHNGRVVLDKFYDDADSGKLADGHAVYAMGIQEFYELSRLSKSEIIRNKLCRRYIHKGNWAARVLEGEIQSSALNGTNPAVYVKKLIDTGKMETGKEGAN